MARLSYEIRVSGEVPVDVLEELDDVLVTVQPVSTILRGTVVDQSALHGLINRLYVAGLELVEVSRPAAPPTH